MARFQVVREVATLGLSMYTFGIAIGPLISAPLSERFGRRPVYIATLAMLAVFVTGAGVAQNIETLIICRFLAGIFGSGAVAVGAGMAPAFREFLTQLLTP
jgi:MFS family permease